MGIRSGGYATSLIAAQMAGAALSASTAETSLLPAQAKLTLPAGYVEEVGQHFRLTAAGKISTVVTTPGTMTFKLKAGSTAILTSSALALNIVAKTNVGWWLDLLITVRTLGASGGAAQLMANGPWVSEAVIGAPLPSVGGNGSLMWQASAPAVGTAFDHTIANIIDFTGTWSVNSGSNSITCEQFQIVAVD